MPVYPLHLSFVFLEAIEFVPSHPRDVFVHLPVSIVRATIRSVFAHVKLQVIFAIGFVHLFILAF